MNYKVKIGYENILNSQQWEKIDIPLNLCLDSTCLPNARIFLWVSIRKIIPIVDIFTKMGFEGPSRCPLCENESKIVDHLLLNCPYARKCWYWLCQQLKWKTWPSQITSQTTSKVGPNVENPKYIANHRSSLHSYILLWEL